MKQETVDLFSPILNNLNEKLDIKLVLIIVSFALQY